MRKAIIPALCAILASTLLSHGWEGDDSHAAFFRKDKEIFGRLPTKRFATQSRQQELAIILAEARRQGIPERLAYKVCKIESGCRLHATGPKTRHGRHFGAYQTRPNVAARFGYRPSEGPLQGMVGLRYGLAHLADCYKRANKNEALAARCHVGGPGALAQRLTPKAERYARSYTKQVMRVAWAGSLR